MSLIKKIKTALGFQFIYDSGAGIKQFLNLTFAIVKLLCLHSYFQYFSPVSFKV